MINKYNNPRLLNTVLTGPGMTHPRNPHVVIGSDNKGFVLGDLMDANTIMETIDQKIDVDNLIDEEKLTTAVLTAVDSILGDVSESLDTLKEVEDKFEEVEDKIEEVEDNIPTKLSLLENFTGTAPEIGDYLYNDFTWGSDSTNAIGICVGTPDMFPDGKARFCELLINSNYYKWSTERINTVLPDITNITNDTYDGWNNTDILISLGEDKYPAAAYARSLFLGRGYLPTARELDKCKLHIKNLVTVDADVVVWSSTESSGLYAWGLRCFDGSVGYNSYLVYSYHVLSFVALDVPPTYITATDLATVATSGSYNDLTNKPTTIAGYGIVDAKIENGVVTLGSNTITPLTSHQDISGKEDKMSIVAGSDTTLSATVNTAYTFASAVGTLAVTLPTPSDTSHVNTIAFWFTTDASPAVTFTSANTIYYNDGYSIEASKIYKVNATYNGSNWTISSTKISHDYSKDYLTFVAKANGKFTFTGQIVDGVTNSLSYSLDNGTTWVALASGTASPTIESGSRILWKGSCTPRNLTGIGKFTSTAQFDAEGNAMSLLYGDDFASLISIEGKIYTFYELFGGNTKIISAENLSLPATTLANYCYSNMFNDCTNLTAAPELPATTLADYCYDSMFKDCTNLTAVPQLPATTLADFCYYNMFYNCSSLATAPELPATTLVNSCYNKMFSYCTSLTTAPELPATTLVSKCYNNMFYGCASLVTAPELPATTLANYCYNGMFYSCRSLATAPQLSATTLAANCYSDMFNGCGSLATAPELPATTLANYCYNSMFKGCTSLTTAPQLPATTLAANCYSNMFNGCTSLYSITCLATNISASNCTNNWVKNVAASGTFTKAASMESWTTGVNGIPSDWTVQDANE